MDILIPINFILALAVVAINVRQAGKDNPRRLFRFAGGVIGAYVAVIYLLAMTGTIRSSDVALFMRWFLGAIMLYLIYEAHNG